jgi:hypothetical protein
LKEIVSEISEEQRMILRQIGDLPIEDRSLLKLPIEIGQNAERIRALESEMGFVLPEDVKENIGKLTKREEEQAFKEIREVEGALPEVVEGASFESLRADYEEMKDELDVEKAFLNREIPDLKQTIKALSKDVRAQRRYIQTFPEDIDEKTGGYSTELRGEEEKYNNLLEAVKNTRRELDQMMNRQRQISRDEDEIKTWFENAVVNLQQDMYKKRLRGERVERFRKATEIRPKDRQLIRDLPKARAVPNPEGSGRQKTVYLGRASYPIQIGQKRGKGYNSESEDEMMMGGAFQFNDSRDDFYKIRGLK